MKNSSTTNYWMYLTLVSIIFNLFLAYQIYAPTSTPTANQAITPIENETTGMQEPKETLLFVQEAAEATVGKNGNGTFTLSMINAPRTLFFSDRPYRQAGELYSPDFIKTLKTQTIDPPNAIVQLSAVGEYRIAAIELLSGTADPDTATMTYIIRQLPSESGEEYLDLNMFIEDRTEFEAATLFIDAFPTAVNGQITDIADDPNKSDIYGSWQLPPNDPPNAPGSE